MVSIMTNDPLCLDASGPAGIPADRAQCPDEISPVNAATDTPSPPAQAPPAEGEPPPYQTPPDANKDLWKARVLRLLCYGVYGPARLFASTDSSQRAQLLLGLIGLGIGGFYFHQSYVVSELSLVLSQKAYKTTMWKDCRDRPDIRNTSVCHYYADVSYDSIAKKRSLNLDVVEMFIGSSRSAVEHEVHSRGSCQGHALEPQLWPSPTLLLCLLHAAGWPLYCAAKVATFCALVYVYAIRMTPIAPLKRRLSETTAYTALLCVALSFLVGCWHADAHSSTIKLQWQFILKGVLCFHWSFAWSRLLQSSRSPLLLLTGRTIWRQSSLFTVSTDVVLFIVTTLFIAHIISSTIAGLRRFPITSLLWLHLSLLTLLYAVGKALRVHAYVNRESKTTFDDEAQEEKELAIFRQSPLVESVGDLTLWLCRRIRSKSSVKKCT